MKKKGIEVSVVIPIYNCKEHLYSSISSILAQTIEDIELVMVNDGSTDGSEVICEELKDENEKIIVIHQKNQGVSAARNIGIKNAKGKYLLFVDSDDYIAKDYIEKLITAAKLNNYDLVSCGGTFVEKNNSYRVNPLKNYQGSAEKFLLGIISTGTGGTAWGKLIKTDIIKKNDILFSKEYSFREDLLFWIEVSKYLTNVMNVDYFGYYYNISEQLQSLSTKYDKQAFNKQLKLTDYIKEVLEEQNISEKEIFDILDEKVTQLFTGTLIKLFRSGNSSVLNVNEILKNKKFEKYKKHIKVNNVKDFIFNIPIKYQMVWTTYLVYKVRCHYLTKKERTKND